MKKISKYSHILSTEKGFYIYSGLTNAFAKIDKKLYQLLKKNNLKLLKEEEKELLENIKFFASENDEINFFNEQKFLYNNIAFNNNNLGLAIIPTMNCNFSCFYCFEENKSKIMMNDQIINDLIKFIKSYEDLKLLDIVWYGGEPLLGFKIIKKIINKIKNELKDLTFKHTIVTNGYLLNEEIAKFFQETNLQGMQITLDGKKERHDKVRFTRGGKGSFDRILNNLDIFFKFNTKTQVSIRVNLDKDNENDFGYLHTIINDRFKGKKIYVYPAFIEDYTDMSDCPLLNRFDKIKFTIDKYKEIGLTHDINANFSIGGCGATRKNYFVVGSEGELYKCWNDVGYENKIVGYLNKPTITNPEVLYRYISGITKYDDPICKECSIFPICSGGCQYQRNANIYENKNYDICDIKKDALAEFLEILHVDSKNHVKIKTKNIDYV